MFKYLFSILILEWDFTLLNIFLILSRDFWKLKVRFLRKTEKPIAINDCMKINLISTLWPIRGLIFLNVHKVVPSYPIMLQSSLYKYWFEKCQFYVIVWIDLKKLFPCCSLYTGFSVDQEIHNNFAEMIFYGPCLKIYQHVFLILGMILLQLEVWGN